MLVSTLLVFPFITGDGYSVAFHILYHQLHFLFAIRLKHSSTMHSYNILLSPLQYVCEWRGLQHCAIHTSRCAAAHNECNKCGKLYASKIRNKGSLLKHLLKVHKIRTKHSTLTVRIKVFCNVKWVRHPLTKVGQTSETPLSISITTCNAFNP